MKVRIKTREQFEKEFGSEWQRCLPSGWDRAWSGGEEMDALFGKVIEVKESTSVPLVYDNGEINYYIDKEMISEYITCNRACSPSDMDEENRCKCDRELSVTEVVGSYRLRDFNDVLDEENLTRPINEDYLKLKGL